MIADYSEVALMIPRRRAETPIERIYREVMGRKMPQSIKRILLPKRKAH